MKGVQCHELFRGIALKNNAFFLIYIYILVFTVGSMIVASFIESNIAVLIFRGNQYVASINKKFHGIFSS